MSWSELVVAEEAGGARPWSLPHFEAPRVTARQLEEIATSARDEAFAQGRREGLAQGLDEVRRQLQTLTALGERLRQPLAAVDATVENLILELSLRIGAQLALRELRGDPAALLGLVREAVGLLSPAPREIRIRLHPDDVKALQPLLAQEPQEGWRLEPDLALARGDCMLAGDHAAVDARLSVRVAEIAASLFGET